MVAFNYDTQEWVEGAEALVVLRAQLLDELDLLRSDTGAKYAASIGVDRQLAIDTITVRLTGELS